LPAAEASDNSADLFAWPAFAAGAMKNGAEKLNPKIDVLETPMYEQGYSGANLYKILT